jgi:hypothetical protein
LWLGANEQPRHRPKKPCWTSTKTAACSGESTSSRAVREVVPVPVEVEVAVPA